MPGLIVDHAVGFRRWLGAWLLAHLVAGAAARLAIPWLIRFVGDGAPLAVPFLVGLAFGVAEWVVLRRRLGWSGWWVPVTALAMAAAGAAVFWLGPLLWRPLGAGQARDYGIGAGLFAGLVVALAQGALLRHQGWPGRGALTWLLLGGLGAGLAHLVSVSLAFSDVLQPPLISPSANGYLVRELVFGALDGAIYAAVTALAVVDPRIARRGSGAGDTRVAGSDLGARPVAP